MSPASCERTTRAGDRNPAFEHSPALWPVSDKSLSPTVQWKFGLSTPSHGHCPFRIFWTTPPAWELKRCTVLRPTPRPQSRPRADASSRAALRTLRRPSTAGMHHLRPDDPPKRHHPLRSERQNAPRSSCGHAEALVRSTRGWGPEGRCRSDDAHLCLARWRTRGQRGLVPAARSTRDASTEVAASYPRCTILHLLPRREPENRRAGA